MKNLDTELSKAKSENKSILDSIQIKETKFQAIVTEKEATLKKQHLQAMAEKERHVAEIEGSAMPLNSTILI